MKIILNYQDMINMITRTLKRRRKRESEGDVPLAGHRDVMLLALKMEGLQAKKHGQHIEAEKARKQIFPLCSRKECRLTKPLI